MEQQTGKLFCRRRWESLTCFQLTGHEGAHRAFQDGTLLEWSDTPPIDEIRCTATLRGDRCVLVKGHQGHHQSDINNKKATVKWPQYWDRPKTLKDWPHYFRIVGDDDVGAAAIELLNTVTREMEITPPKSRFDELFLYRCNHCKTVCALDGRWGGSQMHCPTCKQHREFGYVAVDFVKKIFFTERR